MTQLRAEGISQRPLIRSGGELTIESCLAPAVSIGDLVVYRSGPLQICHRVLFRTGSGRLFLKGDANFLSDGWIEPNRLIGRVSHIDGKPVTRVSFRVLSFVLFLHSSFHQLVFRTVFASRCGQKIGRLRARCFGAKPIFSALFFTATSPWLWRKKPSSEFLEKCLSRGATRPLKRFTNR